MLSANVKYLKILPSPVGRMAKRALVYPRYWICLRRAREAWRQYGADYQEPILFVAGMPKSGTTWLEKMISSYPGYTELLIPAASFAELRNGKGHLFELPHAFEQSLRNALLVLKMHCDGSLVNVQRLRQAGFPYVVLYRDPRDVAVSYYHYVKDTPWHGDYLALKNLDLCEGIHYFINKRLPEFAHWMRSWRDNRDAKTSLMLAYEELRTDPKWVVRQVFDLFKLPATDNEIAAIVEANSIEALRQREAAVSNFFREGKIGGWANHFNDEHRAGFKKAASQLLVEFGYEKDAEW